MTEKTENEIKRVSFCGTAGSFSEAAAKRIFPSAILLPCDSFKEAYEKTLFGEADRTVLPIENSYAGEVASVTDEIYRGKLLVQGVYSMRVVQNLIGIKGATLDGVLSVISHPQALSQCAEYIAKHRFREITSENTAFAAKTVANLKDPTVAAIAGRECAELYGLDLLEENISSSSENATKFAVLGKENVLEKAKENCILFFAVRDVSGALAAVLGAIAKGGYNLQSLRSRPLKKKAWQYYFYAEIEGGARGNKEKELLGDLAPYCTDAKIAGRFVPDQEI